MHNTLANVWFFNYPLYVLVLFLLTPTSQVQLYHRSKFVGSISCPFRDVNKHAHKCYEER
jgi:hypothetical protein